MVLLLCACMTVCGKSFEGLTAENAEQFYCALCKREFGYTPHNTSQMDRHLKKHTNGTLQRP
jgi:hypothetical protein